MTSKDTKKKLITSLTLTTPVFPKNHRLSHTPPSRGSFAHPLREASKSPEMSRPYIAGDPPRLIDWRTYARTDQILVREKTKTKTQNITILCDESPSMHWPTRDFFEESKVPPSMSKIDLAYLLGLHLANAHLKKENPVNFGLYIEGQILQKPLTSEREVLELYRFLKSQTLVSEDLLKRGFRLSSPRRETHVLYWFSDQLNLTGGFTLPRAIETWTFQTMSPLELKTDWMDEEAHYLDKKKIGSKFLGKFLRRGAYFQEKMASWIHEKERQSKELGEHYFLVHAQTKLANYLNHIAR